MTQPSNQPRRNRRQAAVAVPWLAALLLLGCSQAPSPAPAPTSSRAAPTVSTDGSDVAIDPRLLEPLTALGPCTATPTPLGETAAEGALFPEGAVLTSQQTTGPLTSMEGYIPMTPVQIRVFYQDQDRYDVVQVEDEIRESEVLLADGNNRLFVKAQAICELGSIFVAVLAPEAAGDQVPAPAGGGG